MPKITKYGLDFDAEQFDMASVEMYMIKKGGQWTDKGTGRLFGNGLFYHYKSLQSILWPEDVHHRWSDLALASFLKNEITVMMGSGDSNKTYAMSRFALCDYWTFPDKTLWLISSTEWRGAELRIWGKIKELLNRAKDRFVWLPGVVLDSMKAITTDEIDDDKVFARSLQRGMILVPCKKGSTFVGLSAYIGVKAPRLRHAGDEIQCMTPAFLDAYSNWYGKPDFKGLMAGNPIGTDDPLGVAGEPEAGWDVFEDTKKTQEWTSKFFNAHVIAFDGRDSPNFDYAPHPVKFPFLISEKKLDAVRKTYGENSWQWFNQCVGKPNKNLVIWRVITKQICEQHKAFDRAIWAGTKHTWIYALDPAYGGIDRCIGMPIEFGEDIDNRQILRCYPPELVPINLALDVTVEDQIAGYIFKRSQSLVIPPENIFYDSFGRGTLGFAFARFFGRSCPVPVDSGAQPTTRPVRYDLYVDDGDKTKHQDRKRLKRCNEHYSKFVTEMWFSVRECVESEQMRELPKDVMEEGCQRLYSVVKGDRVEVESKDDMKERIGKSPDLFDTLAIGIEGARQRGFHIKRIGGEIESSLDIPDWMIEEAAKQQQILKGALLEHAI